MTPRPEKRGEGFPYLNHRTCAEWFGASAPADRATQASPRAPAGLGHPVHVPRVESGQHAFRPMTVNGKVRGPDVIRAVYDALDDRPTTVAEIVREVSALQLHTSDVGAILQRLRFDRLAICITPIKAWKRNPRGIVA